MDWIELAKPADPSALMRELDETTLIGRFMNLSIHIVHGWEKPVCMAEIGRIREQEFRAAGAGRNVDTDIDDLDLLPNCYYQLVSWDPDHKELVSMYRFAKAGQVITNYGMRRLRTSTLFSFSDDFVRHVLSVSIELGRSVVNSKAHRAIAGLFAVWCGLSILVREYPEIEYFFGNVTIASSLSPPGRDAIIGFLNRFYSSASYRSMVSTHPGLEYRFSGAVPDFSSDRTVAREELVDFLSKKGEAAPPILLSYLKAADDLAIFDTAKDGDFGNAWETAIAVPVKRLNEKTRRRFMDQYTREPGGYFDRRMSSGGSNTLAAVIDAQKQFLKEK